MEIKFLQNSKLVLQIIVKLAAAIFLAFIFKRKIPHAAPDKLNFACCAASGFFAFKIRVAPGIQTHNIVKVKNVPAFRKPLNCKNRPYVVCRILKTVQKPVSFAVGLFFFCLVGLAVCDDYISLAEIFLYKLRHRAIGKLIFVHITVYALKDFSIQVVCIRNIVRSRLEWIHLLSRRNSLYKIKIVSSYIFAQFKEFLIVGL